MTEKWDAPEDLKASMDRMIDYISELTYGVTVTARLQQANKEKLDAEVLARKAEAKLQEAEAKLQEAEAELQEAEARLQQANKEKLDAKARMRQLKFENLPCNSQ